jgi:hypothetical protein
VSIAKNTNLLQLVLSHIRLIEAYMSMYSKFEVIPHRTAHSTAVLFFCPPDHEPALDIVLQGAVTSVTWEAKISVHNVLILSAPGYLALS